MKVKKEEDLIVEEGKFLHFVGADGFHELVSKEKKWELLDSRVKVDFPDFTPLSTTMAKRLEAMEKKCDKLTMMLADVTTKVEEKVAIALNEKDKALDMVALCESRNNDLQQRIGDLTISLTTAAMKHQIKVAEKELHIDELGAEVEFHKAKIERLYTENEVGEETGICDDGK